MGGIDMVMRLKPKLRQKDKKRYSIFLRPDQERLLREIWKSEETYMLDVIEEIIDIGLKEYYGSLRDVEDDDTPAYLRD